LRDGSQQLLGAPSPDAEERFEGRAIYPILGSVYELANGLGEAASQRGLSGMVV
jgi:hypothetical protein